MRKGHCQVGAVGRLASPGTPARGPPRRAPHVHTQLFLCSSGVRGDPGVTVLPCFQPFLEPRGSSCLGAGPGAENGGALPGRRVSLRQGTAGII